LAASCIFKELKASLHNQITTVTAKKKQLLYVPADQGATPVRGIFFLLFTVVSTLKKLEDTPRVAAGIHKKN
jgi:hypothetical protein